MPRRRQHRRQILTEDHLNVGSRTGGSRITYWTGEGPDLANVRPVGDDDLPPVVDLVKDEVIRELAEAWNVVDDDGVVFSLRRYKAADHPSYDVVVDDDRVAGTFFYEGGLVHQHVIVLGLFGIFEGKFLRAVFVLPNVIPALGAPVLRIGGFGVQRLGEGDE